MAGYMSIDDLIRKDELSKENASDGNTGNDKESVIDDKIESILTSIGTTIEAIDKIGHGEEIDVPQEILSHEMSISSMGAMAYDKLDLKGGIVARGWDYIKKLLKDLLTFVRKKISIVSSSVDDEKIKELIEMMEGKHTDAFSSKLILDRLSMFITTTNGRDYAVDFSDVTNFCSDTNITNDILNILQDYNDFAIGTIPPGTMLEDYYKGSGARETIVENYFKGTIEKFEEVINTKPTHLYHDSFANKTRAYIEANDLETDILNNDKNLSYGFFTNGTEIGVITLNDYGAMQFRKIKNGIDIGNRDIIYVKNLDFLKMFLKNFNLSKQTKFSIKELDKLESRLSSYYKDFKKEAGYTRSKEKLYLHNVAALINASMFIINSRIDLYKKVVYFARTLGKQSIS